MMSTTVHRIDKHRCFSFIATTTTSILFLVTTLMGLFNPLTAYGAQSQTHTVSGDTALMKGTVDIHSTITQTDTLFNLTNTSGKTLTSLSMGVFYTRPNGFMPHNSVGCTTPVLSFTPSDNIKDPTNSCPWFTCNYVSWSHNGNGECSTVGLAKEQAKGPVMAVFQSLPPTVTTANTFMLINFKNASLAPGDTFKIDGCIYYDNWPRFSTQQNSLMVFSGNTLLWGNAPSGMNIPNLLKATSLPTFATTGWQVSQPN